MSIQYTQLPNGLRIVTDSVDTVDSAAIGVWAHVGTRHEDLSENGIAHMVEHMLFKGTPTRSARDIAEAVESVGGHMNAYTSREMTAYFMHLLKDDAELALDILADMVRNACLPENEIDRERGVILQEIGMNNDTPDDLIFDQWQESAFPEQSLGAPILGRSEIIEKLSRDALSGYIRRHYTGSRLIVSVAGNIGHDWLVAEVAKRLGDLPQGERHALPAPRYAGGECRHDRKLEQAHVILGFEGISRPDPRYDASRAMSMILGGGMSSRLFQEVREKRGLVYSIHSFHLDYADCGLFGIYAGTGPDSLPELMPVVCNEIRTFTETLTEEEAARARAQLKANFLMSRESMLSRAGQQAKALVYTGLPLDCEQRIASINAITREDIANVARDIFSGPPTLNGLGPLAKLGSYEQTARALAT